MSLFDPLTLRGVTARNRIVISPMSQYIADHGFANDWHFAHLGRFALGGAGIVFTEATAVEESGRRTPGDLGLWHDDQIEGLARIAKFLKAEGAVPAIQLGHAGRKASERRPWHGETPLTDEDIAERGEHPWKTVGPGEQPYGENWHVPEALDTDGIQAIVDAFRDSAARALAAGFEAIEVYAAHGFLLHQFYSPLCNDRDDGYGGDWEGRARLSIEVAEAIRTVWPDHLPLFFRLSATDWVEGGWTVEDTVRLARALKAGGVDVIDCSSGGIGGAHKPRMPLGAGFQISLAGEVKRDADIATMAIGLIWDEALADKTVRDGEADLVGVAREALSDPNWPLHAARRLGADPDFSLWRPQFGWWLNKRARLLRRLGLRIPLEGD